MEATIHDIGRPMIRSSRPTPPLQETGEDRIAGGKKVRGRRNEGENFKPLEEEVIGKEE